MPFCFRQMVILSSQNSCIPGQAFDSLTPHEVGQLHRYWQAILPRLQTLLLNSMIQNVPCDSTNLRSETPNTNECCTASLVRWVPNLYLFYTHQFQTRNLLVGSCSSELGIAIVASIGFYLVILSMHK